MIFKQDHKDELKTKSRNIQRLSNCFNNMHCICILAQLFILRIHQCKFSNLSYLMLNVYFILTHTNSSVVKLKSLAQKADYCSGYVFYRSWDLYLHVDSEIPVLNCKLTTACSQWISKVLQYLFCRKEKGKILLHRTLG